jgi:ferredoxin
MAIPTSRVNEAALISLNLELCTGCGLCVSVCKDYSLVLKDGKVAISETPAFGCIGCGHCMAICPEGAIEIDGRFTAASDLFPLPSSGSAANYEQISSLFKRRRSIREFLDRGIEDKLIDKIINAASTAPMGLPPSDVNLLILKGKTNTRKFSSDFCKYLESMQWFVSKWFLFLMRPIWGKANDSLFKGFVRPLFKLYTGKMREGIDLVTYDAPLAIYFYGSPYSDPADPVIAATYAMIAAESLGLGTCMLGGIHPLIQSGKNAKKFRENHGIKYPSREGLFVIFGYPAVSYGKGIKRSFANIDYFN